MRLLGGRPRNRQATSPAGGTRFIGLYLARQLVEQGHEVTLFTRGKKAIAEQIPDDTPASFSRFKSAIRHIKGDRSVSDGAQAWALRGRAVDWGEGERLRIAR